MGSCIHSQHESVGGRIKGYVPASLALVNMTVWNHVGKLYMTVKLQVATRKLLTPTNTGIFSLSRNGAKIGSGATLSST